MIKIIDTQGMMELTLIQKIAIWAIPLIFAVTIHEVAHGWVASFFGDQTARLSGRLTLNPIKHIDLMGTIIVPITMLLFTRFIFGWAKPVPVDPRNMTRPRTGMACSALAGPTANLLMAIAWAAIAKAGILAEQMGYGWIGVPVVYMGDAGIMINVVLGVLNMIPVPPLDGSRIVSALLPPRIAYRFNLLEPYGFFILLLLLFTGVLNVLIGGPVFYLISAIGALFGLT